MAKVAGGGVVLVLFLFLFMSTDSSQSQNQPVKSPSSKQKLPQSKQQPSKQAMRLLAKASEQMGRSEWSKASESAEQAIRLAPQFSYGYALLGHSCNMMADWTRAAEAWRQAAQLDQKANVEFFYHLGFALHQSALDQLSNRLKKPLNDEAIAAFHSYLAQAEKHPKDVPSASQLAMVHSSLAQIYKSNKLSHQQPLALHHFHKAIEIDPSNELAFFNIGIIYASKFEKSQMKADQKKAISYFEKASQIDPNNPQYAAMRDAMLGKIGPSELMATMQNKEL